MGKYQEAYAKAHSTIPEALGVGQRMCAEQVILTHFSQRYPHMPTGIVGTVGSNVCLAFDFMRYDPGVSERCCNAQGIVVTRCARFKRLFRNAIGQAIFSRPCTTAFRTLYKSGTDNNFFPFFTFHPNILQTVCKACRFIPL